jgi:neutral ceramidase
MTRVGFAQTDISCTPGTPLGGNARVDKAARGVHDPLHATVAVLESGSTSHVLVGLDLLNAPARLVEAMSRAISDRIGLPASEVTVSATHTHSGPDVGRGHGMDNQPYDLVDAWEREAVQLVAAAAVEAHRTACPASLRVGRGNVMGISFNRRLIHRDGSTRMNWEPLAPEEIVGTRGPVDPQLLTLVFSDHDGYPLGAVVHFTLHPAILVGHEWLVSADYVADLSAVVSEQLDGAPVMFLNGALGNINHLDFRDDGRAIGFTESERVGRSIGGEALDAIAGAGEPIDMDLVTWRRFTVTLEQRTVDRQRLGAAQELLAVSAGEPVEALDGIPPEAYARWTVTQGRRLPPLLDVKVTIVRIAQVVLVYVPFEVFVEFGLTLGAAFPDHVVRVVSLGNDYHGYLPTASAFAEGGYEPTLGTSTVQAGQGEYLFHRIETEVRALLANAGEPAR